MTFEEAMFALDSTRSNPRAIVNSEAMKGSVTVLLASPRGFCAGVRRAIDAVRDALKKHGPPVYVRRPIVHNLEVVRMLEAEGAIFVEELDEVPPGSVVIFSAHGVAPTIANHARNRDLVSYDAVCPLVSKVHREVERHQRAGRVVILIGHKGHPEIEGTLGYAVEGRSFVVGNARDVSALPLAEDTPAAYAVQTTYSADEAKCIVEALRERFVDLAEPPSSDICYATTNRQRAIRTIAKRSDHVLVVGEDFSSNARRLVEVALEHCASVQLVAGAEQINWDDVPSAGTIGISAAASTPESSVDKVIEALRARLTVRVEEIESVPETVVFKPLELA